MRVDIKDVIDVIKKYFGFTAPDSPVFVVGEETCPSMKDDDCTATGTGIVRGDVMDARTAAVGKAKEACEQQSLTGCHITQEQELTTNKEACENSPTGCSFNSALQLNEECVLQSCANQYTYVISFLGGGGPPYFCKANRCDHTGSCINGITPFEFMGDGGSYLRDYSRCLDEAWYECIAYKRYNQDSYTCEKNEGDCTGGNCAAA